MPVTKVLIADDSVAVRRLVKETLTSCPDIEVIAAACDGREALALLRRTAPDVILLDVEMPVMDGIDTLRQIRLTNEKTPVVMFSSCLLYTSPSPRDLSTSRMPSSA